MHSLLFDICNGIQHCIAFSKLYTSVPREEGIRACKKVLDSREKTPDAPIIEVLEMIKMVLDNNNFCARGSNTTSNQWDCDRVETWSKLLMYVPWGMGVRTATIVLFKTIIVSTVY